LRVTVDTDDSVSYNQPGERFVRLLRVPRLAFDFGRAKTCFSGGPPRVLSRRTARVDSLWTAIALLTCLPTPRGRARAPGVLVESLLWFPVVGAAIGALLGLAEFATRRLSGNSVASAAVAVGLGLLVTRGVHLRGLMIVAGALFSGRGREELGELAARNAPGGFGLLLGVALFLLRYEVILAAPGGLRFGALTFAGVVGRAAIVWVCWRFAYAEIDTGIGGYLGTLAGPRHLMWALPLVALGFALLGPVAAAAMLAAGWIAPHLFGWWVARQLGGLTAHSYEAVAEVAELASLGAVAALAVAGHI
jgi:adenosylcobinamide-GDP ribazoletransferase